MHTLQHGMEYKMPMGSESIGMSTTSMHRCHTNKRNYRLRLLEYFLRHLDRLSKRDCGAGSSPCAVARLAFTKLQRPQLQFAVHRNDPERSNEVPTPVSFCTSAARADTSTTQQRMLSGPWRQSGSQVTWYVVFHQNSMQAGLT
eukprot:scaffold200644_cov16-Prasinocladus_malaysianus.AAC.1